MTPNEQAFLTMLGISEGTVNCPLTQDRGYDVLVGGTIFTNYADHPRILVNLGNGLESTAAGRYQILERYYDAYKISLKLPDFSPASQDAIALQMISECNAIGDINSGDITAAITKCSSRWASLPNSPYGQHTNDLQTLIEAYTETLTT